MSDSLMIEPIRFEKSKALKISITQKSAIPTAVHGLGFEKQQPVIVLIGGAGLVGDDDWQSVRVAMEAIAQAAQESGAAVIDGGTESGVMAAIGQARAQNSYTFPLIGVAAEGTVTWPGRKRGLGKKLFGAKGVGQLDPQHTHFILVPGKDWGDESPWIAAVASELAREKPSLAVLINGGTISREMDVPNNLEAGRPVFVIEGTGRAADELTSQRPDSERMHFIHVNESDTIRQTLIQHLNPAA